MEDFLTGKKHIHFIGIGGSGMYPLAQILHGQGFYLTGSDNNETETLKAVRNMGIKVFMGQAAEILSRSINIFLQPEIDREVLMNLC